MLGLTRSFAATRRIKKYIRENSVNARFRSMPHWREGEPQNTLVLPFNDTYFIVLNDKSGTPLMGRIYADRLMTISIFAYTINRPAEELQPLSDDRILV